MPDRRAARRRRRDRAHGRRARRASASSCAIRCSPSTRATSRRARSRPTRPWSFDAVTLDGARALVGERARLGRRSSPSRSPRDRRGGRRARRPRPLRRAPGAGVPAPAARHLGRRLRATTSPTRCRSSSTASSAGASGDGCSTASSPAPRSTPPSPPRSRAGRFRPAGSALPGDRPHPARGRGDRRPRGDALGGAGARRPSTSAWCCPTAARSPGPSRASAATCSRNVTYSRVSARHRLGAWVRLLALTAAHPERPFSAVTVGRARAGAPARRARRSRGSRRRSAPRRSRTSRTLVDLCDRGMREPLPIACETSAAYAARPRAGEDARRPRRARRGSRGWNFQREDAEPEHQLVLGGGVVVRRPARRTRRAPTSAAPAGTTPSDALRPLRAAAVGGPARRERGATGEHALDRAAPFDVCGPLPTRRHRARGERRHRQDVHDRGARGTLRRRGHAARPLLLVTFTPHGDRRAARARPRAARRRRAGARPRARRRAGRPATTRCVALLADGAPSEVAAAPRPPGRGALADFDAATIATTHGFCQQVLGGLGRRRRRRARRRRSSRTSRDLRRRGRRRPLRAPLPPPRRRRRFDRAPRRCGSPGSRSPTPARRSCRRRARRTTVAAMRVRLAHAVRDELERRKRRVGRHDLRRPAHPAATRRSRARRATRRPAAARALPASCSSTSSRTPTRSSGTSCAGRSATAAATLVLIGDPKQAIYAFRGADVYAYLDAAARPPTRGDARRQLAQRPGPARRLRRAVRRRAARATRASSTARCGPRDANRRAAAARRAGGAPLRHPRRPPRRAGHRPHARAAARASRSAREHIADDLAADVVALLASRREIEIRATTARRRARAGAARARRRARAHATQRARRPRRARGGRRPGRHQRRRQRVRRRRPARDWLRAARGARAADVAARARARRR